MCFGGQFLNACEYVNIGLCGSAEFDVPGNLLICEFCSACLYFTRKYPAIQYPIDVQLAIAAVFEY